MQTNEREIIIDHALENEENEENVAIVLDITSTHTDMVKRIETLLKDHEDFVDVNIWHWHSLSPGLRKSIIKTVVENSSDITFEQNDNANKGKIIIEHALKNEENLEMTLDIIFAGYELRQRIINNFWGKLQDFIKQDFKKKGLDMQGDFQGYWGTSKSEDLPQITIYIQHRSEKNKFIGIHVDSDSFNNSPTRNFLKSKLDDEWGKGDDHGYWIWKTSNWKYKNWQDPDTLIKMHTGEAVEDIGNDLLKIVEVAEPVIDEWVKENPLNG